MSVYVYAGDRYYLLAGNKIVQSGVYITLKNTDRLVLDGQRYTLGVVPNLVITQRTIYIQSGYSITDAQLSLDGIVYVSSGGTAINIDITSGGTMYVSSGGYVDSLILNVGGSLTCSASSGFSFPVKLNGGYLYAPNGYIFNTIPNTFSNAVLQSGDQCTLASGTTAVNLTIGSGAKAYTHVPAYVAHASNVGGDIIGAVVSSGGTLVVQGRACSTVDVHVKSRGCMSIEYTAVSSSAGDPRSRAYISNVLVSSGGTLSIPASTYASGLLFYSGASVYRSSFNASGSISVDYGYGTLAYNPFVTGGVYFYGNGTGAFGSTSIPLPYVYYGSRGLISRTELLSGMSIGPGYRAYAFDRRVTLCTVSGELGASAVIALRSNALADNIQVGYRGRMYVAAGNCKISSATVTSGGQIDLSSGCTANTTVVSSGGTAVILSGATAYNCMLQNLGRIITSAAKQTIVLCVVSDSILFTISDGVISGGTIPSGVRLFVPSGCSATNLTVLSGGSLYPLQGCQISGTTLTSAYIQLGSGDSIYDTVASNALIILSAGASIYRTSMHGGGMTVTYPAVAYNTTLTYEALQRVEVSAIVSSVSVSSLGRLYVSSGGTAKDVRLAGGYVADVPGAVVLFTPNSFGGFLLGPSPSVFSCTIHSGTTATNISILAGVWTYIYSSGLANSTTVNSDGRLYVSSGGTANKTTVNLNGSVYISNGGIANSVTINSGGSLEVSSGGTALNIVSKGGGKVTSATGAYITYV